MKTIEEIEVLANLKYPLDEDKGQFHNTCMQSDQDAFIAGYTACQEEDRWVPVSERLPENSSTVLVIDEYGGMYTCYYLPNCEKWFTEKTSSVKEIASWQPLPNPPKK